MPTADLIAISQLGYLRGAGYDQPNRYSSALGLPPEAWCGDFVTWCYMTAGASLPSMQLGHKQGFSYVPSAVDYAKQKGLWRPSWVADVGDLFCFDWNGDGVADHVEIMVSKFGLEVTTVGGNSGPAGGVNRHAWNCPQGAGNPVVLGTIDLRQAGAEPNPGPLVIAPALQVVPATIDRVVPLFVLKSPNMIGPDIRQWQEQMFKRGWSITVDGVYGPASEKVCEAFQRDKGLTVDGIVGPITWAAAWSSPVTP
jgi:Putative peptidoglycan binding domain/CHAP domain